MRTEAMQLRYWITAARPIGHGMIALPLLWGQALALLVTQQFDWLWFAIVHAFGVVCQVYVLYLNDYADEAIDRQNRTYWLSGGSRVIPEGYLTGQQLYAASFVALFGLMLLAVAAYFLGRSWMPAMTGLALVLAWTYSLVPIKSSYRGCGELHQALSCGVVLPLIAFYLQSGTLTGFPWLLVLPISLVFFAGNMITALPDVFADRQGGKLTYPVRHGGEKTRKDVLLLLLVAYVLVVAVSAPWLDWWVSSLFAAAPAIALLFTIYQSGLIKAAEASNRPLCKRFVFLTTISQLWVMVSWTLLLFRHGLQQAEGVY